MKKSLHRYVVLIALIFTSASAMAQTISYSGSPYTFYMGTAITALSPTTSGGTPTGYSISPALPTGLAFSAVNGKITGTPSVPSATDTYTITATYSSGGPATTTISVTVDGASYTASEIYYVNVTIATLSPTLVVGTPTGYSASGTPPGVNISPTTGALSGTPTTKRGATNYTMYASYPGGTSSYVISITVKTPTITYTGTPFTLFAGTVTTITPTDPVGTPTSCTLNTGKTLPVGLTLNSNGTITGTPTTPAATVNGYKVTANYTGGGVATSAAFKITVDGIKYSNVSFTYGVGSTIATLTPTVIGAPTGYGVSPALPNGITLNPTTGVIQGTPTTAAAAQNYIITATYAGGTASFTINITVNAASISYAGSPFTFYVGSAVSGATPTLSGTAVSYSISPSVSAGLTFSTSTGSITGTPTAPSANPTGGYTVTAYFNGGTQASTGITINVDGISYTGSPFTYYVGAAITALTPTTIGTPNTNGYSITPNITTNTGLSFSASTGVISGTPTASNGPTTYTISAVYPSGNQPSVNISITVAAPSITYSGTPYTIYQDCLDNLPIVPTIAGPVTGSFTLNSGSNPLPASSSGASPAALDASTGDIFIQTSTQYPTTVGSKTGLIVNGVGPGSSVVTSNTFRINVVAPTITYSSSAYTFYTNTTIGSLTPTIAGTPLTNGYGISPALPAGLSFSNSTGVISGTPTVTSPTTSYTVTTTYQGSLTKTAGFTITITAPPITYSGSPFTEYTGGTVSIPATLNVTPTGNITISPALPAGLNIDPTTGNITGFPTTATANPTGGYTVSVPYSTGTGTTNINITVSASTIAYSGSPFTEATGQAITNISPTVTGTTPTSYAITTNLSTFNTTGLSFNTSTGVISGTPTAAVANPTGGYTITATYGGGVTTTANISLTTVTPSVTYTGTPFTDYIGLPVTTETPTVVGATTGFTITPNSPTTALPTNFSFSNSTGVISGTTTVGPVTTTPYSYTVTATYVGGATVNTTVNISIALPTISYSGSPFTFNANTSVGSITPTVSGSPSSYSISPALSTGLSFSTLTGVISGIPTVTNPSTPYTVTANYTSGQTAQVVINITVLGEQNTWLGGTSTLWSTVANWSTGTMPSATDDVVIPSGTTFMPTLDALATNATTCGSLTITGNTTITLASSSDLNVAGGLIINSGNLTLAYTTGSLSGTTDFGGASSIAGTSQLTVSSGDSVLFSGLTLTIANGSSGSNTQSIVNNGSVTFQNAAVTQGNYTTLNNNSGGNWYMNASTATLGNAGVGYYSLLNSGTFTADQAAGTSSSMTLGNSASIDNTSVFQVGSENSASTLNISGTGCSVTNASTGNFIVASTSTINLSGASSTVTSTNGGNFAFFSDALGSANVGPVASTSSFTGSYYVQRYIQATAAKPGYRLLSCPVYFAATSSSPIINYCNLTWIAQSPPINGVPYYGAATAGLGGSANGFTVANGNPTVYLYDEQIAPATTHVGFSNGKNVGLTGIQSNGVFYSNEELNPVSNTTLQPVYVGTGFLLFYFGPVNNYSTSNIPEASCQISYYGKMNQGTIPFYDWFNTNGQLSYTSGVTSAGYNMVGNPYACAIDLDQLTTDNPSLTTSGSVNYWELTDAGTYASWSVTSGGSGSMTSGSSSQYIASGQGFFVQANNTGETLNFQEDQKYTPSTPYLPANYLAKTTGAYAPGSAKSISMASVPPQYSVSKLPNLHLMLAKDSLTFKTCGLYFKDNWNDAFETYDAKDIDAASQNIYLSSLTSDGVRTGINAMSLFTKGKNIQLFVNATASGTFKLNLMDIANVDTTAYNVYLLDNAKKDSVDLVKNKTYSFEMDPSDSSSFGAGRFVLSIQRKPLPPYQLLAFKGSKENTGISINWKTANEGDYTSFGLQKLNSNNKFVTIDSLQSNGSGSYPYFDMNPVTGKNIYRLAQYNIDGVASYSAALIIPFNTPSIGALLSVYPNPAQDQITVDFTSLVPSQTATYNVNIYNSMGASVMQKSVTASSLTQDVSSLKPGTYIIQILNVNGAPVANTKFIKHQ